ncbi:MAG: hypothetical protein HY808_03725 [Nitrospirae bacterium]|nr:hypothetical protein [Nitrospirota bacterium]
MKITAATILIALFLTALSPLTTVRITSNAHTVSIKMLDVCHQTGSMVLNNLEMPFVSEYPCTQHILSLTTSPESSNSTTKLPLITIPIELPPKV